MRQNNFTHTREKHFCLSPDLAFPSLPFPIAQRARVPPVDNGRKQPPEARTQEMMEKQWNQDGLYWRKSMGIWNKKQGTVKKREDKRDHFSL